MTVRPSWGSFAQLVGEEQTTGSVKSGAIPDTVVVTEFVIGLEPPGEGCANEYMDQIATMIMIGMAIFSHLLKP